MNEERDYGIAAQHRKLAKLYRNQAAGSPHARRTREAANCHDKIAELFDPPDSGEPRKAEAVEPMSNVRSCGTCLHSQLSPTSSPCDECLRPGRKKERWEAEAAEPASKGRDCINCRYTAAPMMAEPCGDCVNLGGRARWEPAEKVTLTPDSPEPETPEPTEEPPEAAETPQRQPGDVWCKDTGEPTTPQSEACGRMRGKWPPGHDPTARGVQPKILRCKHCPEFRTEPDADEVPTPLENTYSVWVYLYHEDKHWCVDVPRLPECNSFCLLDAESAIANVEESLRSALTAYLAAGGIPWLPPEEMSPCPPGATEQVVRVKVKVEPPAGPAATDEPPERPPLSEKMRELALEAIEYGMWTEDDKAVNELLDAISELEANQLDPTATLRELVEHDTHKGQ